jgi:3-deoxy-D-manno-octulosonate 8-phosphate phosphatase (KDO 8-P phosphatase)
MIKHFILDVDGVMTTGHFLYSDLGKAYKIFGPHDSDGLKMLKDAVVIHFITADKRGFKISQKRITDDLGFPLELVSESSRYDYLKNKFDFNTMAYMGDGIFDVEIIKDCKFGIAPQSGRKEAKEVADFVTESKSGEGAVLDACIEIKRRFF